MDKQDELAAVVFRASCLHPGEDETAFTEKWDEWRHERLAAQRIAAAVRSFMGSDEVVGRVADVLLDADDEPDRSRHDIARAALSAAIEEDIGGGRG